MGPRREHILDAMRTPDQQQLVKHEGVIVHLFTKRIDGRSPYVLHVTAQPIPDALDVLGAFKVYDDLEEGIGSLPPLAMLERFAHHVGLPGIVAGERTHFVTSATVPHSSVTGATLIDVVNPEDHEFVGQGVAEKRGDKVFIAVLWTTDLDAYTAYLRAHA